MNKWALITGATSGIGKAFAFQFAQDGYNIIITGTRKNMLQDVAENLIQTFNIEVLIFTGDLAEENIQNALIDVAKNKNILALINNAGFAIRRTFYDGQLHDWKKMISLHISCIVNLTYALLPNMISANRGIIINVSSDSAYMITGKNAIYSGTKAFIKQFTNGLYMDLYNTDIQVQALCPGMTKTDFHKKMGMHDDFQKNKGLMHWEEPSKVVQQSINALKRNKVICITGFFTKIQIILSNCIPKRIYYRIMQSIFRNT